MGNVSAYGASSSRSPYAVPAVLSTSSSLASVGGGGGRRLAKRDSISIHKQHLLRGGNPTGGATTRPVTSMMGGSTAVTTAASIEMMLAAGGRWERVDWMSLPDPKTGRRYVYNVRSGETAWVLPAEERGSSSAPSSLTRSAPVYRSSNGQLERGNVDNPNSAVSQLREMTAVAAAAASAHQPSYDALRYSRHWDPSARRHFYVDRVTKRSTWSPAAAPHRSPPRALARSPASSPQRDLVQVQVQPQPQPHLSPQRVVRSSPPHVSSNGRSPPRIGSPSWSPSQQRSVAALMRETHRSPPKTPPTSGGGGGGSRSGELSAVKPILKTPYSASRAHRKRLSWIDRDGSLGSPLCDTRYSPNLHVSASACRVVYPCTSSHIFVFV